MSTSLKKQRIAFTGGGTAGHVIPNLALIEKCQSAGWDIVYLGSQTGIERTLVTQRHIPYYTLPCGKLRRYFSWQNLIDPFKILAGVVKSLWLLFRLKPQLLFSKGGFVSFPVVVAAKCLRIPVLVHESDITPGLANRLCFPFAKNICLSFFDTSTFFANPEKLVITGLPLREYLFSGNVEKGRQFCGFTSDKKIILVCGGSLGAERINHCIRSALPELLKHFQIAHICGPKKTTTDLTAKGYQQFEYLNEELADVMACADLVISRSGASMVYELVALKKPHILIPLPTTLPTQSDTPDGKKNKLGGKISRGEQVRNAKYFSEKGTSHVLEEKDLNETQLIQQITATIAATDALKSAMEKTDLSNGTEKVFALLLNEMG